MVISQPKSHDISYQKIKTATFVFNEIWHIMLSECTSGIYGVTQCFLNSAVIGFCTGSFVPSLKK